MARRMLKASGRKGLRLSSCGQPDGETREVKRGRDGKHRQRVTTCRAARYCPVCGPREAALRAAEIGAAVWVWLQDEGHGASFVSINQGHIAADQLADLHRQLLDARAAVFKADRCSWKRFRKRFGVYDQSWKIEHTKGDNGPHPGLHIVFLTHRKWSPDDEQAVEAWLFVEFRRALLEAGSERRLGADDGVDVKAVDDPAGIGKYLAKWGVGRELAGEHGKVGRNGRSVPYVSIPEVLAARLGRRNPATATGDTRRLMNDWLEFVGVADADGHNRHWFKGFTNLSKIVEGLGSKTGVADRIAHCTELLPEHLRPTRADDTEVTPGDPNEDADGDPEATIRISRHAWRAAYAVWNAYGRVRPPGWSDRICRWFPGGAPCQVDLGLALLWLCDEIGTEPGAVAFAELAGGHAGRDQWGHITIRVGADDDVIDPETATPTDLSTTEGTR